MFYCLEEYGRIWIPFGINNSINVAKSELNGRGAWGDDWFLNLGFHILDCPSTHGKYSPPGGPCATRRELGKTGALWGQSLIPGPWRKAKALRPPTSWVWRRRYAAMHYAHALKTLASDPVQDLRPKGGRKPHAGLRTLQEVWPPTKNLVNPDMLAFQTMQRPLGHGPAKL